MHQVKNQPLLKFAWDVQNLIQTIESNNPDPGPMRSVWDTICMAMKQVNEPQVIVKVSARSGPSHGFLSADLCPHSKNILFIEEIYLKAEYFLASFETSIINSSTNFNSDSESFQQNL